MGFVLCRLLARFQGDTNRNQILAVPFSVRSMRAVSSKATISGVRDSARDEMVMYLHSRKDRVSCGCLLLGTFDERDYRITG